MSSTCARAKLWPEKQHGPLILCDLASDLRERGLSEIFPSTPG
jgi:hypothetical protein